MKRVWIDSRKKEYKMPCSAVTLSLATISAIIAVALLAIAFSTDNWLSYEVKRNSIQVFSSKKLIKLVHWSTISIQYEDKIWVVLFVRTYTEHTVCIQRILSRWKICDTHICDWMTKLPLNKYVCGSVVICLHLINFYGPNFFYMAQPAC